VVSELNNRHDLDHCIRTALPEREFGARRIAEALQKEDSMVITLLSEQNSGNEEGYKNSGRHATSAEHHAHAGALLTS